MPSSNQNIYIHIYRYKFVLGWYIDTSNHLKVTCLIITNGSTLNSVDQMNKLDTDLILLNRQYIQYTSIIKCCFPCCVPRQFDTGMSSIFPRVHWFAAKCHHVPLSDWTPYLIGYLIACTALQGPVIRQHKYCSKPYPILEINFLIFSVVEKIKMKFRKFKMQFLKNVSLHYVFQ